MTIDSLIGRIRNAALRASTYEKRVVEPPLDGAGRGAHEAVRTLSRSRVAHVLRQLRAAHGLTYDEVQAQTGLSQQTLFDVEYKTRRLTLTELRALAACYDVSVSDILGVEIEGAEMDDRDLGA